VPAVTREKNIGLPVRAFVEPASRFYLLLLKPKPSPICLLFNGKQLLAIVRPGLGTAVGAVPAIGQGMNHPEMGLLTSCQQGLNIHWPRLARLGQQGIASLSYSYEGPVKPRS
jgi:hypothetical protein